MGQHQKTWQAVWHRIDESARMCGRNASEISLLAVSKRFSAEDVRAVYACGQRRFGENYVQEAEEKSAALADLADLSWVLIGPLQKNKARLAARLFDRIETVDDWALAKRLSAARPEGRPPLEVLIQVNISEEPQKNGVMPAEAAALAKLLTQLPRLRCCGFMGMTAVTDDVLLQRRQFAILRGCREAAQAEGLALNELSMGMSADMESAIAEGSTEVRIGSALFGARVN